MSLTVPGLKRILSVDDDENDNVLLSAALKAAGYQGEVKFAADGQEAIELLGRIEEAAIPDLVLIDVNMPRQNGFECLKWLRSAEKLRTVPVVMFTTSDHPKEVERAYQLGADCFLVKPLTYDALIELAGLLGEVAKSGNLPLRIEGHPSFRARPKDGAAA